MRKWIRWRLLLMASLACTVSPGAESLRAQPKSGDGVVRFEFEDADASQVHIVGEFNGWSPNATPMDPVAPGSWVAEVFLDAGTYEYKLLVDGNWIVDPGNPEVSPSGNSVVRVGTGGIVRPPATTSPGSGGGDPGEVSALDRLRWYVRYLGFVTTRRDPGDRRFDLDRPLHDIDVRLETDFGSDVTAWFLMNLNNLQAEEPLSKAALQFDRARIQWRPANTNLEFFDNVATASFEDPGNLVGQIGIYGDDFGYRRRGVYVERRILGAPLQILYADDTEIDDFDTVDPSHPALHDLDPSTNEDFSFYDASRSDRNADTFAARLRAGRETEGLGFGYRLERGAAAGFLGQGRIEGDGTTVMASGHQFETFEEWQAWQVDLRFSAGPLAMIGEYLWGSRSARSIRVADLAAMPSGMQTDVSLSNQRARELKFGLDESRRGVLLVRARDPKKWRWLPEVQLDYGEHDFSSIVTGKPFLMRRHGGRLRHTGKVGSVQTEVRWEHDWFDYPEGSTWQTQFWFREASFWLDEDVVRLDRMTLLGADRAHVASLRLASPLWPERSLDGSLAFTYASPGIDRAPRYLQTVIRFSLPVLDAFELRTHSRIATYRRFQTADPEVADLLGSGSHIEAGSLARKAFDDVTHDYTSFHSHFVELVYEWTERSDVALGFGVDPYVVYEIRNDYLDVGWDLFLFEQGVSRARAYSEPELLGKRLEGAERSLERERRLTLEARLRF